MGQNIENLDNWILKGPKSEPSCKFWQLGELPTSPSAARLQGSVEGRRLHLARLEAPDYQREESQCARTESMVTLRIDRDVLDWLRAQGKGYQTRINQALRVWYDAVLHEKGMAIQKAAEERAAKKAAAQRTAKKRAAKGAAAKRAPPAKKRA